MIYDVTETPSGERFPFSDGCVMIFRARGGNLTVKFDPGLSRDEAARVLADLAARLGAVPEEKAVEAESSPVGAPNPEDVTEDFVRWRDGYAAYKIAGGWWWIKWRKGEAERWGLSGPLMGAVEIRKGPFDNFDETLASMTRHRSESVSDISFLG